MQYKWSRKIKFLMQSWKTAKKKVSRLMDFGQASYLNFLKYLENFLIRYFSLLPYPERLADINVEPWYLGLQR